MGRQFFKYAGAFNGLHVTDARSQIYHICKALELNPTPIIREFDKQIGIKTENELLKQDEIEFAPDCFALDGYDETTVSEMRYQEQYEINKIFQNLRLSQIFL